MLKEVLRYQAKDLYNCKISPKDEMTNYISESHVIRLGS